jgi:hypothetical protein
MQRFILYIFIPFTPLILKAQAMQSIDTLDSMKEDPWEKMLESSTSTEESPSSLEEPILLEENSIDLNTADAEELCRIPGLPNIVASRIIKRRNRTPFHSIEEVCLIEGVTEETISHLRLYATIRESDTRTSMSGAYRSRVSQEIETKKGFRDGVYVGSPVKMLNRFHCILGSKEFPISPTFVSIESGILTEKDSGERNIGDFVGAFCSITLSPLSTKFIIGNYQVETAEGLVLWRSSAFAKGNDVITPARKNGGGIYPSISSEENSFLQGVAASFQLGQVQVQVFYSNKSLNATIDSLGHISSIDQSGLFRTENELQKMKSTREILIGYSARAYVMEGLTIGGIAYRTRFANPLILKNANQRSETDFWMHGINLSYTNDKLDIFSEMALDRTNAVSMLGGITYEPLPLVAIIAVARKYDSEFQSVHGNAFGESNGSVQNETGVYLGVRLRTAEWLTMSLYYDQYTHPHATKIFPSSSIGNEYLTLAECRLKNNIVLTFRFKKKESPVVTDGFDVFDRHVKSVSTRIQENYRLTSDVISSKYIRLRNRIEWITVVFPGKNNSEHGILLSQTIKWKVFRALTVGIRVAFFETDSYESRLYEYEDDLPHTSSLPPLYGRGIRWYFILRYKIFTKVDISAKYSQTIKDGVHSLGSGLDEIDGNTQSLVSTQLDIRF